MASFALGRAGQGRSLKGHIEFVKKSHSPEKKEVEVVKVRAVQFLSPISLRRLVLITTIQPFCA